MHVAEKCRLMFYLAGPVSNCNERQKTEWRKAIKSKLSALGHGCYDPTDHTDWTPLKEMVEIDRSDVVIANLWRESVGTVVGIVQARRKGKPVILIDPNYLESVVLRHIVGKDLIVRGTDEAVNLVTQVAEQAGRVVSVKKVSGECETFSFPKLHDSLHAMFAKAHVEDAILPDLIANAVYRKVLGTAREGQIDAGRIKRLVFEKLSEVARDSRYEGDLQDWIAKLRQAWDDYENVKKDQRCALDLMKEQEQQLKSSAERIHNLELENASLQAQNEEHLHAVRECERRLRGVGVLPSRDQERSDDLATTIERVVGEKPALCVCQIGKAAFSSVFERYGLGESDFARLFELRQLDGKQSNLNHDVKAWVNSYPFVLYAWDGLRHLHPNVRKVPNLISGSSAHDVVSRFIEKVRAREANEPPHLTSDLPTPH